MTTSVAAAPETGGGAAPRRRRRGLPVSGPVLGLLPFFTFVGVSFLVPLGYVAFQAFRRTTQGEATRDPVTQQFIRESETSFTGANVTDSLQGAYWDAIVTSIQLSATAAVIAAVIGTALAWAVSGSKSAVLRQIVTTTSSVTANFGGVPLAFLFIATLDANAGALSLLLSDKFGISLKDDLHFQLAELSGLTVVYLYFLIPLMVLVMLPAFEGLREQWVEAAEVQGATKSQYWRMVAAPILLPSFLGSLLLLFCSAFSAYATAYAVNPSSPLVTIRIASVLSGDVVPGKENLGAALALIMIVIVLPLTLVYLWLQNRTSRWVS